ncbi:MAG: DMT family transporter [Chloroflexota bacterium]|nr:DMT family transporter [Ardenticatenaceae bacterium]
MQNKLSAHTRAVLTALFVTFLWSTSWVLIKIGLQNIPALTFAGLRYFLAFLLLLPLLYTRRATAWRGLTRRDWLGLAGLGVLYYAIAQGTQFLGLAYLPAITFSLLLNGTAVLVAVLGIPLLRERPAWWQWGGMAIFLGGALLFFFPLHIPAAQVIGYLVAAVHLLASSLSSILGRGINRGQRLHPLAVTTVSMGVGSVLLLATGLAVEPWPHLDWGQWGIVVWLAVVNTAVAFTLWNHTLRTLSAMESTLINNTMLIQISLLAWLFLGESLTLLKIGGLVLVAVGALLTQWRPKKP